MSNPRPRRLKLLHMLPNAWVNTAGPVDGKRLYLSFDDGPNPKHTPPLLDLLREHQAKATFFLIGQEIERHPELTRRIHAEGHALGNHSYSHPRFDELSLAEQFEQISRTDRALSAVDGLERHAFRPPRGVLTLPMLLRCIRERRRIDYWSYDTLDYNRRPLGDVLPAIRRNPVRSGDILLMHDDGGLALELLRTLLPEWKAQGYSMCALPVHP
ncbi:polysaccharide deacetylase family protein [Pseudoxanthomonas helianthi]|uniref:Polysaccharide deacetylase family protein n=1 Tax=Pseudoxanthomonas helianthi TaxID=1453541 RepID=A0A940X6Q2_9GAMM|nr:polysaccharide deacetylase family protein [Pseudoxanthomonas helianthi]MBP3985852.1 polysaccharide deacetylase family protein [Pseudoxanthomonas helianthi]